MTQTREILTRYWNGLIGGESAAGDGDGDGDGDGLSAADAFRAIEAVHGLTGRSGLDARLRAWRRDPALFFMHVLGIIPWTNAAEPGRDQLGILEAVVRHDRVAVRSGHKVSKSCSLVGLALWWFCTMPGARVAMTSSSFAQVRKILWYELRLQYRAASARGLPIGGRLHDDPQLGLEVEDGREIFGFSTKEAERAAGISGRRVFYMPDEASGILENIFEAFEGNLAGGGKIILTSNPTRTSGYFYEAFTIKRTFWHLVHVPSWHTPNYVAGRIVVPGLATRQWVDEKRELWGELSPLFAVRVAGDFPDQGSCAVFSLGLVEEATLRWRELTNALLELSTPIIGELSIGVDPSGTGDDPWVIAGIRGQHGLPPKVGHVGTGEVIAAEVIRYARRYGRASDESIACRIDAIGEGWATVEALCGRYAIECRELRLRIIPVVVSESAHDETLYYDKRTEAAFSLKTYMEGGGSMVDDDVLCGELVACQYDPFQKGGRFRLVPKKQERKELGRSPNRRDAYALASYRGGSYSMDGVASSGRRESYSVSDGYMGY